MAPYVLSNAGMGGKRENGSTGVDVVVLGEDIAAYRLGLGGRAEAGDLQAIVRKTNRLELRGFKYAS